MLFILLIRAENGKAQAYNFKHISIQNGLPQSQAYDLAFDQNHRVWIATQGGGLCRYDGSEFVVFTKSDSLISNRIYCVEINQDEYVWIGQRGGVTQYTTEGEFVQNFRFPNQAIVVNDILISPEKEILLATDQGLWFIAKSGIERYDWNGESDVAINKFFEDSSKQIWLCTPAGLLNLKNPFDKLNQSRGLPVDQVECVIEMDDNWIIGTYGGGLAAYNKNTGMKDLVGDGLFEDEIVTTLYLSQGNDLWIGTLNSGVFVYNQSSGLLKNYNAQNGLANNHVRAIIADKWNNVWIGTSGGGISIFQNSPFIKYSVESGLNGNYIYSVAAFNQNIWLGTEGTGAIRVNDTSVTLFDESMGFCSDKVRSVFIDQDGDTWFCTESSGLGIFSPQLNKDTMVMYNQSKGLTSNWVKNCIQNPSTGEILISTLNGGILRISKGINFPFQIGFRRLKIKSGQLPERLSLIFFHGNTLWFIGDENTTGYILNGEVHSFDIPGVNLRSAVSVDSCIWFATSDNGILKYTMSGDSVISENWITTAQGLASNNIYQLTLSENELWVGTEQGLDRLYLTSDFKVDHIIHYGSAEGFEGVETNTNSSCRDNLGNLWFGTVNGLYVYKGGEINYAQKDPPFLMLTDFKIFYESIENTVYADYFDKGKFTKKLLLPFDQNHVGFSFKAIHYTHADKIKYRWKLSGIDRDWTPPGKSHEVPYSNLPPGKYSFSVQASIDDLWEAEPVVIEFEIDQPYYEKWWFKLIYYSAIFLLLSLIFLFFFLRQRAKNKRLRDRLQMEKNMIELEQKALRLQMNPHFIFNVLNSIHNLIILNDPDKARYALAKFSKLMRRVLENSREKFISIDNEVETLENYIQLERLTSGTDVELSFVIDENLDTNEDILPPLLIQPFVENALIHGIRNAENKTGKIIVGFQLVGDHLLECSVEDNGQGRAEAAKFVAQKENYHKSTALKVTQERLASLNKKSGINPFEIIDLKTADGNAAGTRVVIRIEI
ncbi:MAG: histidine kinase [Crocinitomicaceae bacterium]|nr:histidine kinase [Crocinitomicaceae bacterium]MBK8924375.1 histidine kinase [Crocinitomicaceae bacterium]